MSDMAVSISSYEILFNVLIRPQTETLTYVYEIEKAKY